MLKVPYQNREFPETQQGKIQREVIMRKMVSAYSSMFMPPPAPKVISVSTATSASKSRSFFSSFF